MDITERTKVLRRRKPTKKSRLGCRNCKLRSVKCDETKPGCGKCRDYGVQCNFDRSVPELQPLSKSAQCWRIEDVSDRQVGRPVVHSLHPRIMSTDGKDGFELDDTCVQAVQQFRLCTMTTIGNAQMFDLYVQKILPLAFSNPFLMHTLLVLTASHSRYLAPGGGRRSVLEVYHESQSVALLNKKLSQPIDPADRDPLWATAALLGIITFASFDATSPEDAWPLKPTDSSDLEWMRLGAGKKAIWNATDPLRPGGIFRSVANIYDAMNAPLFFTGVDGVPAPLVRLCGLNGASTRDNNPYFTAAHVLARLQRFSIDDLTTTEVNSFTSHLQPSFKALVREKDPIALLLIAMWYSKAKYVVWWMQRRAIIEGQAICIYLQRFQSKNTKIAEYLPSMQNYLQW